MEQEFYWNGKSIVRHNGGRATEFCYISNFRDNIEQAVKAFNEAYELGKAVVASNKEEDARAREVAYEAGYQDGYDDGYRWGRHSD